VDITLFMALIPDLRRLVGAHKQIHLQRIGRDITPHMVQILDHHRLEVSPRSFDFMFLG
jgi:hypothetical protein